MSVVLSQIHLYFYLFWPKKIEGGGVDGGSNGIKFLIFQVTTSECIIGSFDQKLSKFLFLGTDPLKGTGA